jgi:hypothetical protein
MSFFKGGMDLPNAEKPSPLSEEELAVMDKLAKFTTRKGMTVPAIMFLESVKPLNFIGSQTMVFFEPIVQALFTIRDYNTLRCALEKRETIEILILKIEEYDAVEREREKRIKKFYKAEKKKWKWHQRYLGLFPPKVKIPDEVLNPPEEIEGGETAGQGKPSTD